ncbi:hypothetical protein GCM10017083_36980 [Thalassobaculum fulvum]|uniref:DUF2336 domain-containing protein n=1 Tax=Thalassobaculum fulvum TaxID=1633335 RepID=A0A918XV04_9PROT|nr:DUF2336 domain-containing protein [Thalassobaculum fulvum]GHD56665.1 hypothetical protein GCM10017083_36980 [Thalassobaculum fulvum]
MTEIQPRRRAEDAVADPIAHAEATRIARSGDAAARRALAKRPGLAPELLFYLAEDDDVGVRRAIAANPETPRHAHQFLARDDDAAVRASVAQRIGSDVAGLKNERRAQHRRITIEALEALALDTAEKVRQRLAEAVKDAESAPPEVVRRVIEVLARDTAHEVAGPVLEHSPLLSDDFLIGIVGSPANTGAVTSISRRRGVSSRVSDAVASSGDDAAIAALLANESAQIREATLDRLIDMAPEKPSWHAPLVARPKLSAGHVGKLARFVAIALVEELRQRTDLDEEASARLTEAMSRRIEEEGTRSTPASAERTRALSLYGQGELDELSLTEALTAGRRAFVMAALSVRSGLPEPVVHSMMSSGSAKVVTALAWKAGMTMEFAEQLQLRLAYIEPRDTLRASVGARFPLDDEQLDWQVQMYAEGRTE